MISSTHKILLERCVHNVPKKVVYIGEVGHVQVASNKYFHTRHLYKYGITNNIYRRVMYAHKKRFEKFDLLAMYETDYHRYVENVLTKELRGMSLHITMPFSDSRCRELFYLENASDLVIIEKIIRDTIHQIEGMGEISNK